MPKKNFVYERAFDPTSDKPLTRKKVVKAIEAIFGGYERRSGTRAEGLNYTKTKNEDPKYFLRREIYALGILMIKNPPESYSPADLVEHMRQRPSTRPDVEPKTFHALLMCVYKDDDDKGLSRKERWDMAKELSYAYRHDVPPKLLTGFLLQSGKRSEIPKKLKDGYIDPAFRSDAVREDD